MHKITPAQFERLRADGEARYAATLCEVVQRDLHLALPLPEVSALIARAQAAGLTSRRDIAGFVLAATALAAHAPDLSSDWLEQRLHDRFVAVPDRLDHAIGATAALLDALR